ncbi:TMhelix containing protein [Vibrio phage 1.084.O._10N.261.49.F5]|nr:TMhelix containing protein [Vibrio phage 1.084.O._10N.261.49.F5]
MIDVFVKSLVQWGWGIDLLILAAILTLCKQNKESYFMICFSIYLFTRPYLTTFDSNYYLFSGVVFVLAAFICFIREVESDWLQFYILLEVFSVNVIKMVELDLLYSFHNYQEWIGSYYFNLDYWWIMGLYSLFVLRNIGYNPLNTEEFEKSVRKFFYLCSFVGINFWFRNSL